MFGFCGSNGAGKTTTMRIAMGLVRADAGDVRWQGRSLDQETRRRIGYMPEERGLYPKMKVGEQVAYFARLHGLDAAAATRAAGEWVERLGLGERRGDAVEKLSLGNQQRVQLAAALVSRPEVLILDEPFSGLDPVGVDSLAEALLEQAHRGVPVVFSSHQLDLVERLCDSVGILARGRMVATGTVDELRRQEAGRVLRVVVPDAAPHWAARIPGVRVVSERNGDTLLALEGEIDDQQILTAALRTGRVTHFAWREPTLVELFREAVTHPAGGGGMSEPRPLGSAALVRLVAGREISARLRDKNFIVSSVVILVVLIGILALQVALNSGSETTRVGVVGDSAELTAALEAQAAALDVDLEITAYDSAADARTAVEYEDVDGALLIGTGEPELLVQDSADGALQAVVQGAVAQLAVAEQLAEAGVTSLDVPQVAVTALDPDADADGQRVVSAIIGVGVLYSLLILFGQFVAQGVVEEKASRVVERLATPTSVASTSTASRRARGTCPEKRVPIGVAVSGEQSLPRSPASSAT